MLFNLHDGSRHLVHAYLDFFVGHQQASVSQVEHLVRHKGKGGWMGGVHDGAAQPSQDIEVTEHSAHAERAVLGGGIVVIGRHRLFLDDKRMKHGAIAILREERYFAVDTVFLQQIGKAITTRGESVDRDLEGVEGGSSAGSATDGIAVRLSHKGKGI